MKNKKQELTLKEVRIGTGTKSNKQKRKVEQFRKYN